MSDYLYDHQVVNLILMMCLNYLANNDLILQIEQLKVNCNIQQIDLVLMNQHFSKLH